MKHADPLSTDKFQHPPTATLHKAPRRVAMPAQAIGRRTALKLGASFGLGAWATAPSLRAANLPETRTDVLVVGGGTAGTIAALQAARAGARTMVVEMEGQLGGTGTTGGVQWVQLFNAYGRQVIAGIGWELVTRAVELDGSKLPDIAQYSKSHGGRTVGINGQLYAALAEESCVQAGVSLNYHEFPEAVRATATGWEVETVGKGMRRRIACRQLIDCTGGADMVGLIGLPRRREKEAQPGTLIFQFAGYDTGRLKSEAIEARYRDALSSGQLREGDFCYANQPFMEFLKRGGANQQHVFGADSSTSATKTQANIAGRASMLRLLRFVRSLPGCEQTKLTRMMQETAVRETYRIVGEVTITHQDYVDGRQFEDAVGYSFYPIDLHHREGVEPKPLAPGVLPTIPLRALTPKDSRHLLVAGRSISSDRLANSALRVQASCMAMGQGAGAAAALAADRGITPLQVPIGELRGLLQRNGAILPPLRG